MSEKTPEINAPTGAQPIAPLATSPAIPTSIPLDTLNKAEFMALLQNTQGIEQLVRVVARLRHPTEGCPWDLKQTHQSLKQYMLEEAYEAVEAIDEAAASQNPDCLKEELGDVLLQVLLHSQLAQDQGDFNFTDVCQTISEKLVRRHPHVFGEVVAEDSETVVSNWEAIKRQEKAQASATSTGAAIPALPAAVSILKGISRNQPALSRAMETSKKAVKVGFEWPDLQSLWDCVMSEFEELRQEIEAPEHPQETPAQRFDRLESEMGDIFFASVNLARHLKIDPEVALTKATAKFTRRFQTMEALIAAKQAQSAQTTETGAAEDSAQPSNAMKLEALEHAMAALDFEAWDKLWRQAKAQCDSPKP